jgi:peptidoglycan/LPS O-acetylase OafA/YrhL
MKKEIPSLTGIRGVAALLVFAYHAGFSALPGGFGVTVFFFLSGYLITTLLRGEIERTGTLNLREFYWRRAKRILPPMYLVLALALLVSLIAGRAIDWSTVTAQGLHFTNYARAAGDPLLPATGVMWSLSIEEHFYLLFPVALLALMRRKAQVAMIFAWACLAVLGWRVALSLSGIGGEYLHNATDTRIDAILFGCILAMWRNPLWDRSVSPVQGIGLLGLSGVALLLAFAIPGHFFHDTVAYTVQSAALLPVFYCAIRFAHWPLFQWLEWRPVRALGLISYTFYLSHTGCLVLAQHVFTNPGLQVIAGFAGSVAFSGLSYALMERPLTRTRRKMGPVPLPVPAT